MKKILLATTSAVCVGGIASAEMSLSGEGKLGVSYSEVGMDGAEVGVVSSADVKFTLSGISDYQMLGGFGASFSLDADESYSDNKVGNPFVVYVGSANGTLGKFEIGSGLGAEDKKCGGLGEPGLNGLGVDDIAEAYYSGSGRVLQYEKSIAGPAIARSVDLDDAWEVGGKYVASERLTIGAKSHQNKVMRRKDAADASNEHNSKSFGAIGLVNQFSNGSLYSSRSATVPSREAAYGVEHGYKFTPHFVPIEFCVHGPEGSNSQYILGRCMYLICRKVFDPPLEICKVIQPPEASQLGGRFNKPESIRRLLDTERRPRLNLN